MNHKIYNGRKLKIRCPACKGLGSNKIGKYCGYCSGFGKVPVIKKNLILEKMEKI